MTPVAYLDVDGVLADFVGGVCKLYQTTFDELRMNWKPGSYAIEKALGVSLDEMWGKIHYKGAGFWESLEVMPYAYRMVEQACEAWGPENVVFVTSPSTDPFSSVGKIRWIHKHFPQFERRFCITPVKWLFAHPEATLIDDYDHNINEFCQRGGLTKLVPRYWNSLYLLSDMEFHV